MANAPPDNSHINSSFNSDTQWASLTSHKPFFTTLTSSAERYSNSYCRSRSFITTYETFAIQTQVSDHHIITRTHTLICMPTQIQPNYTSHSLSLFCTHNPWFNSRPNHQNHGNGLNQTRRSCPDPRSKTSIWPSTSYASVQDSTTLG